MRESKREVKLRVWLLNHSAIDTADQCGVSRHAIYKALRVDDEGGARREVILEVRGDIILDAFEYKNKVQVFGFKGQR